jgi:hypothetical protein
MRTPRTDKKRNFVDFVWEIGRAEGAGSSGGTYGYGKTSFFRMSRVRAICVHSRCLWQGKPEERFIAAYLGPSTSKKTGRAWWGNPHGDAIGPLTGHSAAELAHSVGMPPFLDKDCGTSIMMLCPRLEDLSRDDDNSPSKPTTQQILHTLAESLVQWFWPKMMESSPGNPEIRFRIFNEGQEFPIPSPENVPPFNVFSEALHLLKDFRQGRPLPAHAQVKLIECLRPHAKLGHLVMVKRAKKNRNPESGEFGEASARDVFAQSHHVVLLRKPMLVVKYLRGARPPSDQTDYAGVFVVDHTQLGGNVERAFALSEPPTHDDWVPETLEDRHQKTFVRVALRRIKEAFGEFAAPITAGGGAEAQQSLGAFSELLGDLLAGTAEGTGARIQPQPGTGKGGGAGGGNRQSKVEINGPSRISLIDGKKCLIVPFNVTPRQNAREVRIRVAPVILLEQGTEKDPPKNATFPRIHSFCRIRNQKEETIPATGNEIAIPAQDAVHPWFVRVILPNESRIRVDMTVVT